MGVTRTDFWPRNPQLWHVWWSPKDLHHSLCKMVISPFLVVLSCYSVFLPCGVLVVSFIGSDFILLHMSVLGVWCSFGNRLQICSYSRTDLSKPSEFPVLGYTGVNCPHDTLEHKSPMTGLSSSLLPSLKWWSRDEAYVRAYTHYLKQCRHHKTHSLILDLGLTHDRYIRQVTGAPKVVISLSRNGWTSPRCRSEDHSATINTWPQCQHQHSPLALSSPRPDYRKSLYSNQ